MQIYSRPRIAIAYHFFPHYRRGIINEIREIEEVTFIGDSVGEDGIKPHEFAPNDKFVTARCFRLGKFLIQPRLPYICMFGNFEVFVFLASPNHLTTWIGAILARLRGKRVIFWGHGFKSARGDAKNAVRKIFFSIPHAFYTYGYRAKKNAASLGFDPDTTYVGFNSLNYSAQLPIRQKLIASLDRETSKPTSFRIFCISRLTQICRYDLLLTAASILSAKGIECKITFIGDGPEMDALRSQAHAYGVDADFLGALYDESKIAEHIYSSDVTVSPGKVGLTAMHSLMFGTPVITNDNFELQMPEVEAIVPGHTGAFFLHGSAQDLADKLIAFQEQFRDRQSTRIKCFSMIDRLYNPKTQARVMHRAILGLPAEEGNDAFTLFEEDKA